MVFNNLHKLLRLNWSSRNGNDDTANEFGKAKHDLPVVKAFVVDCLICFDDNTSHFAWVNFVGHLDSQIEAPVFPGCQSVWLSTTPD